LAVVIQAVDPHSPAGMYPIKAGDTLVSINGNSIQDVLDYDFYVAETDLNLVIKREDHTWFLLHIQKDQYEDLGLSFATYLMDSQRTCTNDCVFCFVDQMPPNMRESLYFKDDDARLSFLMGNYITLTNMKEEEIDRIVKMRISPINVSVHTTNPELRCKLMKNRFAGEKLKFLEKLAKAGITVNCQLVLCPGLNDGEELTRTLKDLGALYPGVQSVACVPVGLTKYRDGLYPLESYNKETASAVIDAVEAFAARHFAEHGTHLAYASDEFYLRAERPLPDYDYYEDFAQLENGVGVLAELEADFNEALFRKKGDRRLRHFSLATGTDAAPYIRKLTEQAMQKWPNLHCTVYAIENHYFGPQITVAGLVTATDLIGQLKGCPLGDALILPDCMLRHERDKFLDDLTVADVEEALGVPVILTDPSGDALLETLTGVLDK